MAKPRLSRAARLRKRKAFAVLRTVQRDAVVKRNLGQDRPVQAMRVVRNHAGTLLVVPLKDGPSSPDRLGIGGPVGKPGRDNWEGRGKRIVLPAKPRWHGADKGAARIDPPSAQPVIGASKR